MTRGELLKWAARHSRGGLVASWIGGLGYQGGLLALPWAMGHAVDGVRTGDRSALLIWAGATLAVSIGLTGAEWAMRWWSTLAGVRTGNAVLLRLADRVLGWDAATAHRFSAGDLVVRGTRDAEQVTVWLSTVPSLASGMVGLVTVLVLIATLDPMLALIGLAALPLLILVNLWYPRRYERANEQLSAAHGARADAVEDLLAASTAVRGLGGEAVLIERHHEASRTVRDRTLAVARVAASWSAHAPFIPWLATAAGVAVGGFAVLDGRLSVGGLTAFAGWMALLGRQVMMLTLRFSQFGDAWTAAGRIAEVLDATPSLTTPDAPKPIPADTRLALTAGPEGRGRPSAPAGDPQLALTAVPEGRGRPSVPAGDPQLALVAGSEAAGGFVTVSLVGREALVLPEMTVADGEFVAVTGAVGSGKSTLLRLLARLADPDTGVVTLGGTDLRDLDLDELRATVTLVGQRPLLLSGTIADNLRLGRVDVTDERIREACRRAAILGHVESLPDGFGTELGERGSGLSGGQAQRLALARGLLRGGRVLLLDDVTSAVDAGTEQRILDGLRELGCTVVFATSRPAVAARADRVIHLGVHDGELVHG
ncbi:ABC transporter ATP-binding protein [Actinoplanes sp. HUAS TT8]|uniref:ABC transporter ATP-binding protein n=1 Tax=Actinoplanes sp. HUAS TT8 TaxID=3447453 RepID=UPI003F5201B5